MNGGKEEIIMSDLIDRQEAIDAFWQSEVKFRPSQIDEVMRILEQLPSAQPEIIHCKDCKYCSHDSIFDQSWCNYTSGVRKVKPTDFCSCGKRRTNEGSD